MSLIGDKMIEKMSDMFVKDETKGLYVPRGMESTGEAYGFLNYDYDKEVVEKGLLDASCYIAKSQEELHLSLIEGTDNIDETDLLSFIRGGYGENFRYIVKATYRGVTNSDAAIVLGDVLNQIYQSDLFLSPLNREEVPFEGNINIAYKDEMGKFLWTR